jgi:predicted alpha/beta superfamily hydrolase
MQGNAVARGLVRASRFVISAGDAVHARMSGIERFELRLDGQILALSVALPLAYAKSRRRRYPLLILQNASDVFGSAIEMSRLLVASGEAGGCIVVNVGGDANGDASLLAAVVGECRRRYRVDAAEVAMFAHNDVAIGLLQAFGAGIAGVTRCILGTPELPPSALQILSAIDRRSIAWTTLIAPPTQAASIEGVHWKRLPEATPAGMVVTALLHGVLTFWGRAHKYGDEVVALAHPLAERSLRVLAPLLQLFTRRPKFPADRTAPRVIRSQAMSRDFEVFITLPESARTNPERRYPTVVVLDANGCFATLVETTARLAKAGDISEAIIVGIGTPRSQGDLEFAFRRFEELSPPTPAGYCYDDELGRFFRSIFSLRGQDARVQLGQAPAFHEFINRELLPQLIADLPIDSGALSVLGHSASGTYVAYELAQSRSLFSGYFCLSPGVAIGGNWMRRNATSGGRGAAPALFVAIGAEELSNRFNTIAGIPQTPAWVDELQRNGGPAVPCHLLESETHTTVYARAVAQGLCELLFAKRGVAAPVNS